MTRSRRTGFSNATRLMRVADVLAVGGRGLAAVVDLGDPHSGRALAARAHSRRSTGPSCAANSRRRRAACRCCWCCSAFSACSGPTSRGWSAGRASNPFSSCWSSRCFRAIPPLRTRQLRARRFRHLVSRAAAGFLFLRARRRIGSARWAHDYGVPVKNAAGQSGEFVICIFGLLYLAIDAIERRRWPWLVGICGGDFGMLANILFVATSRTALLTILLLLALFALKKLRRAAMSFLWAVVIALGAAAWFSSPYLRDARRPDLDRLSEIRGDRRSQLLRRAHRVLQAVAPLHREAPIVGHGTGSIPDAVPRRGRRQDRRGGPRRPTNPHNQTFAVAIQLGLVGAACYGRCGSRICCCSAAEAWRPGSGW